MQNEIFLTRDLILDPMSGRILILELLPRIFLANKIVGFFKV